MDAKQEKESEKSKSEAEVKKPKESKKSKSKDEKDCNPRPLKKRAKAEFETECDKSLLGRVFVNLKSYACADVIRVVGWTKKMYIVEYLKPLVSPGGYSANVDWDWVDANPVVSPLNKKGVKARLCKTEEESDEQPSSLMLKCEGDYYSEHVRADKGWNWVEY